MGPRLNCCVNCSYTPSNSSENNKGAILHEMFENSHVGKDLCVKIVKVETVLSSIYKLKYLKDLENVTGNRDNKDPLFLLPPQEDEEEFGVCENCSTALADLWTAYGTFNKLSHLDSILNKKISTLDHLIQTLSIESDLNVNVKSEIDEDSGENSDENFMDNDDNSIDHNDEVSHLMKCEFQEEAQNFTNGDNTTTSCSKINFKPRLLTTATTLIVSEPSVSIRRLNDDEITAATKRKRKNTLKKTTYKDDDSDSNGRSNLSEESSEEEEKEYKPQPRLIVNLSPRKSKKIPKRNRQRQVGPDGKFIRTFRGEVYQIPNGTCPICQAVFNVPSNLTKHLMTHIEDKTKHVCPLPNCTQSYTQRESIINHLKNHSNDIRYTCPAPGCTKNFTEKSFKTFHLKSHYRNNIYICRHCDEIFDTKSNLQDHQSKNHPQIHSCPACPDKVFEMEVQLNDHIMKEHPKDKPYLCTICLSSYKFKRLLQKHLQSHETKNYICSSGCGRKFLNEKGLQKHEDSNCKGPPERFKCPMCSRTFRYLREYTVHLETHKGQLSPLKCTWEGCDKTFCHKFTLNRHLKTHTTERNFTCDTCGQNFKTKRVLMRHLDVHGQPKAHLCSKCGKAFLRVEGLYKHMKVHSDAKGYTCEVCHKEFKYAESRRLHFLTQHQEAQFVCTICNQGFPYNFSLQKHLSTAHEGQ